MGKCAIKHVLIFFLLDAQSCLPFFEFNCIHFGFNYSISFQEGSCTTTYQGAGQNSTKLASKIQILAREYFSEQPETAFQT